MLEKNEFVQRVVRPHWNEKLFIAVPNYHIRWGEKANGHHLNIEIMMHFFSSLSWKPFLVLQPVVNTRSGIYSHQLMKRRP